MTRGARTWWVVLVGVVAVMAFCGASAAVTRIIKATVIQPFVIPTAAMAPAIAAGDRVVVSKRFDSVEPGDIIVFSTPGGSPPFSVKRIIAVGGQTVDLRDGAVYVDGELLDEPYVAGQPTSSLNPGVTYPVKLSADSLWVMGDNRANSGDSRVYGPVALSAIVGKAFAIYWPPDRAGSF